MDSLSCKLSHGPALLVGTVLLHAWLWGFIELPLRFLMGCLCHVSTLRYIKCHPTLCNKACFMVILSCSFRRIFVSLS